MSTSKEVTRSEYGHMPVSADATPTLGPRLGAKARPLPWVKPLPKVDFAALFRGTASRLGASDAEIDLALRQMETP